MRHIQFAAACWLTLGIAAGARAADQPAAAADQPQPTLWFPHPGAVRHVLLSADGRWLATQVSRTVFVWEAATGKEKFRVELRSDKFRLSCAPAFAPDSRTLACPSASKENAQAIDMIEVATGKKLRSVTETKAAILAFAFSPDGKQLATSDVRGVVRLWDADSGKPLMEMLQRGDRDAIAFAPDGKTIAVGGGDSAKGKDFLTLWDVTRNREISLKAEAPVRGMAFTPDGKLLASASRGDGALRLWEVDSGKEIRSWPYFDWPVGTTLVFSPGGGLLSAGPRNGVVRFWEALAGDEIPVPQMLAPDSREAGTSAFARTPTGRFIAARFRGNLVAVQDVTDMVREARPRAAPLKAAELEPLWAVLAEDPAVAYPALVLLIGAPPTSVPFIKERVLAAPRPDTRRLEQLLADLEGDHFDTRRKANAELEKMGEAARAALERTLADKPALEVQLRIERLLDKIRVPSAEQLRWQRTILGLEHMSDSEARDLLQIIAQGRAGGRAASAAKAALERLTK
jgi:hypothetical protein